MSEFEIPKQTDGVSCGPTSLYAVYRHYGLDVTLEQVSKDVERMPNQGTLDAFLGIDALKRGMTATIVSSNIGVLDPSWKGMEGDALAAKLESYRNTMNAAGKYTEATVADAYARFVRMGGVLQVMSAMPTQTCCKVNIPCGFTFNKFDENLPAICGLSYTALFHETREDDATNEVTDMGRPVGQFVVVTGKPCWDYYDIADPWDGPRGQHYSLCYDELDRAILLGTLTNDGGILIVKPKK